MLGWWFERKIQRNEKRFSRKEDSQRLWVLVYQGQQTVRGRSFFLVVREEFSLRGRKERKKERRKKREGNEGRYWRSCKKGETH